MTDRLHTISECVTTGGTIRCKPWLRWNEGDWYWACCHPDLDGHLAIAAGATPPAKCPLRRGQDIVQIDPELLGQEEIARKLGEQPPLHAGHGEALEGSPLIDSWKHIAEELHDLAAAAWQSIRDAAPHGSDARRRANAACDLLLEGGRLWLPRDPLATGWPWIDVADRLPEHDQPVLTRFDPLEPCHDGQPPFEVCVAAYDARFAETCKHRPGSYWYRCCARGDTVHYFKATAWMPLPDVPAPVLPKPLDSSEDYHPVDVRPGGFTLPEGGS